MAVLCLVTQSCPILCDPMDCSPPGSSVPGDFPGKNTGVGCRVLLQTGLTRTSNTMLNRSGGSRLPYSRFYCEGFQLVTIKYYIAVGFS